MTEVLSVLMQPDGSPYYTSASLRRSSPPQPPFLGNSPSFLASKSSSRHRIKTEYDNRISGSAPSSAPSSPVNAEGRFSNPPSYASKLEEDTDDQIIFPSYDEVRYDQVEDLEPPPSPGTGDSYTVSPASNSTSTNVSRPGTPDPIIVAEDDTAVRDEPSRHVDYLSHDWKEEDLWSSWRHVVSKRKFYSNSTRLENASWRTWTKSKYRLKTVSPETLNWLKDCDITWLYGPLQTYSSRTLVPSSSPVGSVISTSNSFLNKKPILKKRSMSEMMLQRSLSSSSLLKQAAAAIQAQQSERPRLLPQRAQSDFTTYPFASADASQDGTSAFSSVSSSGLQSPGVNEKKRIHFNDMVEQCIAVDVKGDDEEYESYRAIHNSDDDDDDDDGDDSSEDGIIMMKSTPRGRISNRSSTRESFSGESKTIAMLPSTTLKYREDTPEPPQSDPVGMGCFWNPGADISPSPSQETLRPSETSNTYIFDEEDDEVDMAWEPSGAFTDRTDGINLGHQQENTRPSDGIEGTMNLRRTPSGMFMPCEEDEEDSNVGGFFGRVVDTVNTAKDIAHVIWNVGWRR
ncbi:hypothetical protein GP486_005355 [Trichoglossum hirsutum]|uniref:Nitrogen regulatory protein areA GATA-like domain-containing protein n=1 Tax=Trichoglossum hirsutum TaxID=265104 RepID=A0A9P8RMT7_9PEZI|nr:hypothetical protein GP486_005355 [Trichoglossum hirsutum]